MDIIQERTRMISEVYLSGMIAMDIIRGRPLIDQQYKPWWGYYHNNDRELGLSKESVATVEGSKTFLA